MAIKDHVSRVSKLRARIVTVDPTQRLIEVVTPDAAVRRLAVFETPPSFTWPKEGEEWSIYQENGYWYLGNRFANIDDPVKIEDLQPGDNLLLANAIFDGTYAADVGDGTSTAITLTHNLGTRDLTVLVRETSSPYSQVFPAIEFPTLDTIKLSFGSAPTTNQYKATCIRGAVGGSFPGEVNTSDLADNAVTTAKVANKAITTPKLYLDTQTINGASEAYSSNFTTVQQPLTTDGSTALQLIYTPVVDCWWEVTLNVGLVLKVDAAYNYMYGAIMLSPNDAAGVGAAYHLVTQHNSVNAYDHRQVTRIFKLAAGTTYTAQSYLGGMSGGTWQYYRGAGQLWMNGKAWAR